MEYDSDTGTFNYRGYEIDINHGIGYEADYEYHYSDYDVYHDGNFITTCNNMVEAIEYINKQP